jgi:ABC-type phosphate/phosphonate transport system ATPase subunit
LGVAVTIDEAAEALGVELLPWQREVGKRILNGERVAMVGGRRAGRTALRRVVNHARGDVEIQRHEGTGTG